MLNTLGIFVVSMLSDAEIVNYTQEKHYFWFGEVMMASNLAGALQFLLGSGLRERPRSPWHLLGLRYCSYLSSSLCLKLVQCAMKADADAVIDAFGKNEQVKKVFWSLFVAMAGLVPARVVDPVTAQQVVGQIAGMGV
jgi:hypothetical protein